MESERFNRTKEEGVRSMLHGSGMPIGFWAEAALCFNHTNNRTPTSALKEVKTPLEAWSGIKPKVFHLTSFGCKVSVHIPDPKRKKLSPKLYQGVFLGYSLEKKGYRVWDSRKISAEDSRDVIFYEEPLVRRNLDNANNFIISKLPYVREVIVDDPEHIKDDSTSKVEVVTPEVISQVQKLVVKT
jgi:hypothetical protein